MSLGALPQTNVFTEKGDRMTSVWQAWFGSIQNWLGPQGAVGSTTTRPKVGIYVGLSYFDTTLGKPVFVQQVSPSIVWVDATGGVV